MPRISSKGTCEFCKGVFGKRAMATHLAKCAARQAADELAIGKRRAKPTRTFRLLVEGRYAKEYWLHVAARADATLVDLDQFLRAIWLECCGHMSRFSIVGQDYGRPPIHDWDINEASMNRKLGEVLAPQTTFTHEYDYGSTTELTLKVIAEQEGVCSLPVQLLARNEPPLIPCFKCGKPAAQLCMECYDETGVLCAEHASEHGHDEEMYLPVVNSPRVGTCGYTGPTQANA